MKAQGPYVEGPWFGFGTEDFQATVVGAAGIEGLRLRLDG